MFDPIQYDQPRSTHDCTYDLTFNPGHRMRDDERLMSAFAANDPWIELAFLARSSDPNDRIRAAAMYTELKSSIKMPEDCWAIYQAPDKNGRTYVWVASLDKDMLEKLYPFYCELWENYENQWPHTPNRKLLLGQPGNVRPSDMVIPNTTPAEIIGVTMLKHDGMYSRAPRHLQLMHPDQKRFDLPLNDF